MKPPIAKKITKKLTIHNHTRIDPYYWLNDRENSEVVKYLNQENNYASYKMKHTENLQNDLFQFTVIRINRLAPADLNKELFDEVYPKGKVKT